MKEPIHPERIGGTTASVGDCYVWTEIHYLDSPTDYCEYLSIHDPQPEPLGSELVMLDELTPVPSAARISLVLLFAGVILITLDLL